MANPTRAGLVSMVALGAAIAAGAAAFVAGSAEATSSCGRPGYSYAGFQAASAAHGVRADVLALARPRVESGHVAAWVGLGGPGQGAGGEDAWIQTGLATFGNSNVRLYYEINRPGLGPRYTELLGRVPSGTRLRIAVREVHDRAGWWAVWVNAKRVSEPVYLAGSRRWSAIATAEAWDGGRPACNLFTYRFDRLAVVGPHGVWRRFPRGYRFQDPGYRVITRPGSFVARSVRPAPRWSPTARTQVHLRNPR